MKNKGKQAAKSRSVVSDAIMMLPLGLALGLVPVITRYAEFKTNLSQYGWYAFGENGVDFFLKDKSVILIFTAVAMLLLAAYKWFMDDLKWKNSTLFIPLGIYFLLTVASTLFSEYRYFGIHGISDQFESIWVIAGYMVCAYYAFLFVSTLAQLKILSVYFIAGTCIINAIGLTQALNIDFFQTGFGKRLITPSSAWNNLDTLEFSFPTGYVYTTLYNPNYVGVYLALIIPVLCAMFFCYKGWKKKTGLGVLILVTLYNLVYSRSQGGQIALAASALLTIVLLLPKLAKKWRIVAGGCLAVVVAAGCLVICLPSSPVHAKLAGYFAKDEKPSMTALSCDGNGVHFTYKGDDYTLTYMKDADNYIWLDWLDEAGNGLQTEETVLEDGSMGYTLPGRSYSSELYVTAVDLSALGEGLGGIALHAGNLTFYFTNEADGTYQYINNMGRFDELTNTPKAVFSEYGNLFSGRGFLWAKTIPLLKDYVLLGSGADTFTLVFPNNDYLDKANNGYDSLLVTKPHCLYLQIGVQSGVLALLAFLVFQIWYLVSSLLVWLRNDWKRPETVLSCGIAIGVTAYLIAGLVNDSCVAVAPIYWCLIGIGCAINHMLCREEA